MTPEGLYRRRKWGALLRRQDGLAGTSRGAVGRAMRALGLEGIRRVKKIRTTISGPDGKRAGDLVESLNRPGCVRGSQVPRRRSPARVKSLEVV